MFKEHPVFILVPIASTPISSPVVDQHQIATTKVKNIGFDRYIDTWILQIYRRYVGGYFYMNIDISKINKNTLKFMKILCKRVKMTLIKYTN